MKSNPIDSQLRALMFSVGCWIVAMGWLPAQTLREAATNFPGLRVGAAIKSTSLTGGTAAYANTVRYELNAASPENDTKWGTLRPTQATFAWANADAIATFNRAAGQQMRGHTFQWYKPSALPAWLSGGGFTAPQVQAILYDHIDQVGAHYRGDCFVWDVVNEAFSDSGGALRTGHLWYDAPGIGYAGLGTRYIEETFKRARTADPDALLFYNEYGAEEDNTKSDAVYAMAQDFLTRGVPLDGIGFQMHISGINYTSLRTNFKRFNDLGLDLHITEMDVRVPVDANGDATPANLDAQAEIYWNVLGVALGQPHFKGFQTWGLYDGGSWIPGFFTGYGAALLFDKTYQRKPAYWAVWNALANQAEKLPVLDVSAGDSTNVFSQDTLSAGAGRQLAANAPNDFMTLSLAVPTASEWNLKIGNRVSGVSGQFQVAVAPEGSSSFTNIGGVVDAYSGTTGTGATDLGNYVFPTAGNWQVRFTVAGKNATSSGYNLTIDTVRITPVSSGTNTPPTITNVTDKTTNENVASGPFTFTIDDAQTAASTLTVQAVSLNTTLLPTANIVLGGSGASRTVTLTPAANQFGSAAVLLLVSDGVNTTPETFVLNVTEVDYNPNWTRTTTGTQSWSTTTNWLPAAVPASSSETRLRFLEGLTLNSGTVTANNNLAGTFTLSSLTLGGTGASGAASGVTLSGSALNLAARASTGDLPVIKLDANKSAAANSSLLCTVAHNITLADNTALTGNGNADFIFSGSLGGPGSLTMNGGGLVKLAGTNTYNGPTAVNSGTFIVQSPGSLAAASSVVVNSGGTFGGNGTINGTVAIQSGAMLIPGGANTIGTLTLANGISLNGSSLTFDLATVASSDRIAITGNVVLNGANTLALTLPAGTTPPGTYTLMTYAAKTGTGTLTLAGSYPNATLTVGATSVVLTVATREATWKGSVNGTWDSITANWWVGGTPATYAPGDIVTFDDSATGNFTVSGNASPSSVTVNNSANNYTLSGIIGGAGTPLLKSGTALLTLSGANTYTGTTTINDGTLDVGALANGSLGSGGLLFAGGVLQGNGTFTRTLSGLATAAAGQVSGVTGGYAAKGGQLTLDLGAAISLNTGGYRFGTNFIFGSATADSLVKLTSNIDFGGANRNITVNPGTGGDAVEFSGVVSNGSTPTLAFIKGGAGVLILSGNNTNTGTTTINAGTLRAAHNNAFGTGTVVLGNTDAVLELANGITVNRALTVSDTGNKKTIRLQSEATTGEYSGSILVSETTAANFELSSAAAQTLRVSGKISGTAGAAVNKRGAGTAVLSGANDYTTPTVISGGFLTANTLANAGLASSIGAATDVSTNLVLNGGTLRHDAASIASTNRKFALGLTGGTLDSSAVAITDIVNFSTTLAMGFNSQLGARTLTLTGSNAGDNILNLDLNDDTSGNPTNLVKEGAGKWLITGTANDYTGNTTVNAGTLVLADNAGLKFQVTNSSSNQIAGTGTVLLNGDFTINTAAVTLPSGSWTLVNTVTLNEIFSNTFTVVGWAETANVWSRIEGTKIWQFSEATGLLSLSDTNSYDYWINTFTSIPIAERGPADDPDHDGTSNLLEFALNGNPADPLNRGLIASLIQDSSSPAGNELTLILAVRDGAVFTAGSATVAGITYTVEGSLDLAFPSSGVSSTGPSDTAPAATGLPSLAGTAWEYHTFKLDASEGLAGKGFLRLKVAQP